MHPSFHAPGPMWRGIARASNEVFATGDGCSMRHAAAHTATAMRNATGDDVSPHALWQATMMSANGRRDPCCAGADDGRQGSARPPRKPPRKRKPRAFDAMRRWRITPHVSEGLPRRR
jgi:hypothetical protein